MTCCNDAYKGSKFAPLRKEAEFLRGRNAPQVLHYEDLDENFNMRHVYNERSETASGSWSHSCDKITVEKNRKGFTIKAGDARSNASVIQVRDVKRAKRNSPGLSATAADKHIMPG